MHSVLGDFSRWLTHAHLLSSCYQSLFHSKVICTRDPSCIFAANSRVSAVKCSASLDPTLPHLENTTTPQTHERIKQCVGADRCEWIQNIQSWQDETKCKDRFDLILPVVSLNIVYFRVIFWHIGFTVGMWRTGKKLKVNAACAVEIWNHSAILDKKLNFLSDPTAKNSAAQNPENLPILVLCCILRVLIDSIDCFSK